MHEAPEQFPTYTEAVKHLKDIVQAAESGVEIEHYEDGEWKPFKPKFLSTEVPVEQVISTTITIVKAYNFRKKLQPKRLWVLKENGVIMDVTESADLFRSWCSDPYLNKENGWEIKEYIEA